MKKFLLGAASLLIGATTALAALAFRKEKESTEEAPKANTPPVEPTPEANLCEESVAAPAEEAQVEEAQPELCESAESAAPAGKGESDPLFLRAVELVAQTQTANQASLRRSFSIGYGRAAAMITAMEQMELISAPVAGKPRVVNVEAVESYLSQAASRV